MSKVSSNKSKLIGLLAILAMLIPMFSTPSAAQDTGKIIRIHHPTDPDVVDHRQLATAAENGAIAAQFE